MLQTNGKLTRVVAPGSVESYDGPDAGGSEKWSGLSSAYLRETRRRQTDEGGGNIYLDRLLLVEGDLAVDWKVGDIVTFQRTSGAVITAPIQIVQRPEIDDPEIPSDIITVRLTLEPA